MTTWQEAIDQFRKERHKAKNREIFYPTTDEDIRQQEEIAFESGYIAGKIHCLTALSKIVFEEK